ncbi:isoaspartyl peptidase/L-asparaginase, partial [Streptomyces brasiliscabiei]|uniref:isoaspartyl peptidase/L-asparaginase n=1 Tax=Streptomyces brasiliscabiei TaxID=2736302 RepID=UPI00301462C2
GAGTFAENESCAVSATGHGEYFIRYNVAADICARVKYQNKTIVQAGDEVINGVLKPIGGTGGVIIVDKLGNISLPFNTSGMYRAS